MAGRNDAAKFVELAKFYQHYTAETAEFSKCIKFENGLRAEIKRAIGYQKIRQFSDLVSSCRIYEEDIKAHYKVMNERRGKSQQSRPKPYSAPADQGKQRLNDERRPRRKDTPAKIVYYKCGEKGSVTTSLVCLRCPLSMLGRDFEVDLVCLPLSGMDVIIRMNWLEYNHVHINCFSKTMHFSSAEEESEAEFLTTKQLKQLARDGIPMFSLMASLSVENQAVIDKLQVVCKFQKFFLMKSLMCRQRGR